MGLGRALAMVIVGLALAAACGDDGETVAPGAGGSGGVDDGSYRTSDCGRCVAEACAGAIDACTTDQECSAYLVCIDACPVGADGDVDIACAQQCPTPTGDVGASLFDQLTICKMTGAGSACEPCNPGAVHADPQGVLNQQCAASTDPNTCYACEDEKCCESYAAYMAAPEAVAFFECYRACLLADMPDCGKNCYEAHPSGFDLAAARFACLQIYCFELGDCGNEALTPCAVCMNEHCAAPFVELTTNPAGFILFWDCLKPPCDQACIDACRAQFPAAWILFDDYLACVGSQCGVEC